MKTVLVWLFVAAVLVALFGAYSTVFPGANAVTKSAVEENDTTDRLRDHVETLAQGTNPRDKAPSIQSAGDYLDRELRRAGLDVVEVDLGTSGVKSLVAEVPGTKHAKEIVIVASHFDGPRASPGADAGASGAAVLVEIARALGVTAHERTLRFVLFSDGFKRGGDEGSAAANYAANCKKAGEEIAGVVYLDSVGLYEDKDTQTYPFPLMLALPSRADFVAVVGGYKCRDLASKTTELMRDTKSISVEAAILPEFAPGLGFAPHVAFWDAGYSAVAITDTGEWRSARWATPTDTYDRLDYTRMTRLVTALSRAVGLLVKKATLAI